MTRFLFALTFILGAITVIWVGMGFLGTDLVALTATVLIALVYGLGFLELRHFRRATGDLSQNLEALPNDQDGLVNWLGKLPASLRNAVSRRIEGEPAALPGPMLTPYLSGLLVMLGLLGTFIGMIVTLRGAVTALEGGTELHALRSALAAPINGLSLAFGTSIAGVAASAMLGLAAALSRRERIFIGRELDGKISQELRPFSLTHQRRETYQALRDQSGAFPEVVTQLKTLATRMEQMSGQLTGALTDNQQRFHDSVSGQYQELAHSVGDALKHSLTESGRLAAQSTRPIMEEAMAHLNQQVEGTHQRLSDITERQLATLSERFQATTEQTAQSWQAGLAEHQQTSTKLASDIHIALKEHNAQFQQHSAELLTQTREHHQQLHRSGENQLVALAERFQATTEHAAQHWQTGLGEQQHASRQLAADITAALQEHNDRFRDQSETLLKQTNEHYQQVRSTGEQQLADLAERFQATTENAAQHWQTGLAGQQESHTRLAGTIGAALQAHNEQFQHTANDLLGGQQSGLDALVTRIGAELATLRDQEAQRGEAATQRLAGLEKTVAQHLATLGATLEAPMARLIETASETPRAAAEVIHQLRAEMAKSSERDNDMLEERRRIMAELETLLAAQSGAATAQREAVESLIRDSGGVLREVSEAFSNQVAEQAHRFNEAATDVTGSAHEVASLSDAFSTAVQLFSDANDKLVEHLQRIETALEQASARSDEQLAYYVEQAREVIDLSMTSQKDVLEALGTVQQSQRQASTNGTGAG